MTYDDELILFSQTVVEDEVGNQTLVETPKPVLCGVKSIGRSEFYSATSNGLKPEIIFVLNKYEYDNESKAVHDGTTYKVMKTYSEDGSEDIELTCERSTFNG